MPRHAATYSLYYTIYYITCIVYYTILYYTIYYTIIYLALMHPGTQVLSIKALDASQEALELLSLIGFWLHIFYLNTI